MEYGLIGEHLPHSFSAEVHKMLGNYDYTLHEVERDRLTSFMQGHDFKAINVTIPYKEAVMPFLDEIEDGAREIGAVNTVVKKDGKLYGYNTDLYGLISLIKRANITLDGKKTVILGTGGTSKTAQEAAKRLGASSIVIVSRRGGDAITYEELYEKHTDAEILINATPVGMFPHIFDIPVDLDRFGNMSGVVDVIYNPLRTGLLLEAEKRGIKRAGGLYMLTAQAARAAELFGMGEFTAEKVEGVYGSLCRDKENIILIGMPASGKTTVGKILSEMTGKPFLDTDDLIVEDIGMPIGDYFAKCGEEAFRERETEILRRLAPKQGTILATGGGAILREENRRLLRMNGRLFFLDRPLCDLIPTDSRPTASTKEAMAKRYAERYPIYLDAADVKIPAGGEAERVAKRILEAMK